MRQYLKENSHFRRTWLNYLRNLEFATNHWVATKVPRGVTAALTMFSVEKMCSPPLIQMS